MPAAQQPVSDEVERTRHCSKCNTRRPVASFSILRDGTQRRTCVKHEKRSTPTDHWRDVRAQLRSHGSAAAGHSLHLDVCIDYEDCPIGIPVSTTADALSHAAHAMARIIWKDGGFRWAYHMRHEGKAGVSFFYFCAQDKGRQAASEATGKRTPTPSIAIHECYGKLLILFKPEARLVNIRLEHKSHALYCDRSVHPEVIEYIEAHLDSTPRQIYQDIRVHPDLKNLSTQTTQKQVWYWWGERSASSWRLCDDPFDSITSSPGLAMLRPTDGAEAAKLAIEEFVNQHPPIAAGSTSVSSHMLGQTISSEGGIRGIALYALGIIAALREQVVEISLDATFGTNSSGHDLFAVLAELNGTGAPLMYFLLDTKDMRGDGRRIEMLAQVLAMLKGMGIKPRFVGCDKESAEINAIGQVWPDAKVQLCYWHVRRALRQRLGSGKATTTSAYDSVEAAQTVPGLDVCWGIAERRRHGLFVCTCQSRRAPTAQNRQALNTTWDTAGRLELAKEDTEDLINFISRHFNLHSLFPTLSGAQLTAEQLRVQAATEVYQHCHAKGWARVWAYLWANWYRREDWERWARSACTESVPVLKTTMICESHWRVVKHDYLHRFARPRIDHVTHIIRTRLVPQLCARVGALLSGNTRMAMPSWRRAFVVEWRKREDTEDVSAETLARYRTCPHRWTCACESFLQSRFLFCKHLITMSEPMSTAALKQMHRHRTPPFWTHAGLIPLLSAEACEHCGEAEARAEEDADENGMNGGADDEGDDSEGYDGEGDSIGGAQGVGDDGPDDDEEVEMSVQELFDSAMTILTRTGELLQRERPWGSRALIEAVLCSNRQNIKLLEEDEHRCARQSQARTWKPGQHPATMYLRGERPV